VNHLAVYFTTLELCADASAGNLIGSEGAAALAPMMQFLPALTALHLDCKLSALPPLRVLRRVQISEPNSGNEIGPPGIKALAPFLTHLTSLRILALGGECILR
jgi:hypothetical protein